MAVNIPLIVFGRLLFGLSCGVLSYAGQKLVEETAPVQFITKLGTASKSFLFAGILVCLILGFSLAGLTDEELKENESWRSIYGFQYICQIFTVILLTACFPEDSIGFNIEQGKHEEALRMIKKIYA